MKDVGQALSWAWVFIGGTVSLAVVGFLWIILDQTRSSFHNTAAGIGANMVNLNTLESLWGFGPVVLMISWGLLLIVVAAATRGGEQYA